MALFQTFVKPVPVGLIYGLFVPFMAYASHCGGRQETPQAKVTDGESQPTPPSRLSQRKRTRKQG